MFSVTVIINKYKVDYETSLHMEASESKWVNPDDIQYGVDSLRLGGLHIWHMNKYINMETYMNELIAMK